MSELHIADTEFEMLEHPYGGFQMLPEQLSLKFRTIWVKRHMRIITIKMVKEEAEERMRYRASFMYV